MQTRTLSNGLQVPTIGYGTGMPNNIARQCVAEAINVGYRLIDTAEMYEDEVGVGEGINASQIPREKIFVTSKLNNNIKTYEETIDAFQKSLQKLNMTYIDIFLIHWPNPSDIRPNWQQRNAECWRALEDLYLEGKIHAIGVSNFWIHHLVELKKTQRIAPMINQLFLAPGESQPDVTKYCQDHNIQMEAYSPLGKGKVQKNEVLNSIAKANNLTPAQVALCWSLSHSYIPIPRSTNTSRMYENINSINHHLSSTEITKIDELNGVLGKSANPDLI